jgi:hypothetical protein
VSKQKKFAGETSVSLAVFIQDTSSTTGGGLSGVTSASSGLVMEYRRQGQSSWTTVTPVAGKVLGTYLSGGIVADGSLAGAYEVDFPDVAFASGVRFVICRIRGVTNMLPVLIEVELDAVDYQQDAFGALKPTTAGRTLDVSAGGEAGIDLANIGSPTSTVNLSGITIKTATDIENALLASYTSEIGQSAPPANASLVTMIRYLYKAWRNKKTQTASQYSLFADDGVTVDQKATVSDDGTTTTIGEIGTGP